MSNKVMGFATKENLTGGANVTATVAKWFDALKATVATARAIVAGDVVHVASVNWSVNTADAAGSITFTDESGNNQFLVINCAAVGNGYAEFSPQQVLIEGEDILATVAGTIDVDVWIGCGVGP